MIIVLLFVCPLKWCQWDEHTVDDELQVVFSYHTDIFHAPTCTARSHARILRPILHPLLGWSSPLEHRRTCGWRIHRHNSKGHWFEHSNEGGVCSMTLVRVRARDQRPLIHASKCTRVGPFRQPPKPRLGALPRTATLKLRKDTMAILFVAFAVGGTVSGGWFASANEDGSCERGAPREDSTYTTNFELVRKPRRRECRAQTRTRLIRLCH